MRKKNKLIFLLIFVISVFYLTSISINASNFSMKEPIVIQPMADILKWRVKKVDGITYIRLFNYSTNTWVGEWQRLN